MLSHALLSERQRYDPKKMLRRRAAIMMLVATTCIFHLSSGVLAFTPSIKTQPSIGVTYHGAHRYHGRSALGYSNKRDWPMSVTTAAATRRRRDNFPLRMISLEVVGDKEIPEMAEFFVSNFWEVDVPPSQRRPLVRELVSDYRRRYGSFMGKRKFPSMLLSARNGAGEVVGCVAIEVSVCMEECVGIKARGISPNAKGAELRPILANLAVGRSSRRKGLAKRLVKRCEEAAKEWGYDEVLLLVEENNNRAKRLYQKLGYKTLFVDRNAKKVVADPYQIRDVPCVNVCMRRDLNANIFSDLFSQFIRQ